MGNQQSHGTTMQSFQQNGGIYVQTNQANYATGQTVEGNIYLNLLQQINCQGIYLTFTGYELVYFEQEKTRQVQRGRNHDGTPRYVTQRYMDRRQAHRQFFNSRMLVHNYQGPAMPGQYQYPFSFQLPEGLPGDFEEERRGAKGKRDYYQASIRYTLTAECAAVGWRNDIVSTQPIIVDEALRGSLEPVSQEKNASVRLCCCIPRGNATMKVHFDKNCYMPGETASIICEADNQSKVDFKAINVKLVRTLKLKAQGDTFTVTETLFQQSYPGVKSMETACGENARQVPIRIASPDYGLVQPQTSRGKHVTCVFHVIVEYDIPYCPDIVIKLPIEIYQLTEPNWGIQQAPEFWNPQQVYQPQQVAFDFQNEGPQLQFQEPQWGPEIVE